jgi:hypothetical protein
MDKYIIDKKTRQASKRQQRPLSTNTATVSVNYLPLTLSPQIETLVYRTQHCKKENRKFSETKMVNERNSDEENQYIREELLKTKSGARGKKKNR